MSLLAPGLQRVTDSGDLGTQRLEMGLCIGSCILRLTQCHENLPGPCLLEDVIHLQGAELSKLASQRKSTLNIH